MWTKLSVFLLCAVIALTCTNAFASDDTNESSDISLSKNDLNSNSNEPASDAVDESLNDNDDTGANDSQMFAIQDENELREDNENVNVINGSSNDDDADERGLMLEEEEESKEVEMDEQMKEKVFGIDLPVCGAFAELDYPLHVT
jgi:hypothetical protein